MNSTQFNSKSTGRFDNESTQSNTNLSNFYTNTAETLATVQTQESLKSNKLPSIKNHTSGKFISTVVELKKKLGKFT